MRTLSATLALATLVACAGDDAQPKPDTTDTAAAVCDDSDATWDGFTQGYMRTWCTPCHSSTVGVEDRRGAPPGVDFDTYEDTLAWLGPIGIYAVGDDATMPPAGGVPPEDFARFEEWLACGAPGPTATDPADPCDTLAQAPAGTAADTLCAGGFNATTDDLLVDGPADLSCLCDVQGDLSVGPTTTSLELPSLRAIGGDLSATDTALTRLTAASLASVGGSVRLERNPALAELALPELDTIAGGLVIVDEGMADDLPDLHELTEVGSLEFRGITAATTLELFRLGEVHGDLLVQDNPGLQRLHQTSAVQQVDGDLRITGNPQLQRLEDFSTMRALLGTLELGGNGAVSEIEGFDFLQSVGGDLILRDEITAQRLVGFHVLETIGGTLRWTGLGTAEVDAFGGLVEVGGIEVIDNPALAGSIKTGSPVTVTGSVLFVRNLNLASPTLLASTTRIDGDLVIEELQRLDTPPPLGVLTEVGGSVRFVGSPRLPRISTPALTSIGGDLEILEHAQLQRLDGMLGLQTVGGDLVVQGNSNLPPTEINALIQALGSGLLGDPYISDNGF